MNKPLIIFDLDGTLLETAPDLLDSLNYSLHQEGLTPFNPSDIKRLVGQGGRVMIERALKFQNVKSSEPLVSKLLAHFFMHYENNIPGKTKLFPGLDSTLQKLKSAGFIFAICTNKNENLAKKLLSALKIDQYFSAICGGDHFDWRKPDPRHIFSTIDMADGHPSKAIMVGDSCADILAAQKAHIPVVAVDFGYSDQPVQALRPTKIISHFDELTPKLAQELL